MREIYRGPEKAYASMDFTGKGYITEDDFLQSLIVQRIGYQKDDIKEFFRQHNLYQDNSEGIGFDKFKKIFFPQLF